MDFLTTEDFSQVATSDELEMLHQSNTAALDKAETSTMEYFKGYLRDKFDMTAEFQKEDEQRSAVLVLFMCDYTIWTLLGNEPDRFISEARIQRKDDVEAWLTKCQKGTINPGFDSLTDESGKDVSIGISFSSNKKVSEAW